MQKVIVVDECRCLACKQCMLSCAMAHTDAETLVEAVWSDTPPQPRVHVEPAGDTAMPVQCHHCEDAPCISACPTGAIDRESNNAPVLLDYDKCIGCRFCMLVCPSGAIDLSCDGKAMVKCDQCIERTSAGQPPACVAGCPTGAMQFVELNEYLRQRRREAVQRSREDRAAREPQCVEGAG